MTGSFIRELEGSDSDLRMDRAIAKLRDEVTGVTMQGHRGHNRNLAMVITKLDEARQWAVCYLEEIGGVALIDRSAVLAAVTDETDETIAGELKHV